jgi:hypothetical protein
MNKLELDYWKSYYLETKKIREYMKEFGSLPEYIIEDMYSDEKLIDEKLSNIKPRIGPEYQINPKCLPQ